MICQMILFLRRSRVWSLEIGCWQGHGEEVRVQSTVGRSISDAADDDHSSEDRWKNTWIHQAHCKKVTHFLADSGWWWKGQRYKGGGKPPGPLVSILVKKPTDPEPNLDWLRMCCAPSCACGPRVGWQERTGTEQITPTTRMGFSTNYWWQFVNTTAHINNKTNGYACDATGYTFFWTVAI